MLTRALLGCKQLERQRAEVRATSLAKPSVCSELRLLMMWHKAQCKHCSHITLDPEAHVTPSPRTNPDAINCLAAEHAKEEISARKGQWGCWVPPHQAEPRPCPCRAHPKGPHMCKHRYQFHKVLASMLRPHYSENVSQPSAEALKSIVNSICVFWLPAFYVYVFICWHP